MRDVYATHFSTIKNDGSLPNCRILLYWKCMALEPPWVTLLKLELPSPFCKVQAISEACSA